MTTTVNNYRLVNKADRDAKRFRHVVQSKAAVRLQQLFVGKNSHFTRIVAVVWIQIAIMFQCLLNFS